MEFSTIGFLLVVGFAFLVYLFKRPNKPDLVVLDGHDKDIVNKIEELKKDITSSETNLEKLKESSANLSNLQKEDFWRDNK